MKISFFTPGENTTLTNGFGVAGFGMVSALQRLGHEVPYLDPAAPVEIAFSQPVYWEFANPDSYKIGYAPWESTRLPIDWLAPMRAVDEVWTTSPWCKSVFEKNGIENVRVFEHGVTDDWKRKRRRPESRQNGSGIRFLHIGEPAPRKGGQLVFDVFSDLFGNSEQASLTIKTNGHNTVRGERNAHPHLALKNVKLLTQEMSTHELVDLVLRHDVLVYPSYGEGFGLIPLQAIRTGMPVICTDNWAPYADLILPELSIPSRLTPSPWPDMHPGMMYEPDVQSLAEMMQLCVEDYQSLSVRSFANSFKAEARYDWDRLTQEAFAHIFDNSFVTQD